MIKDLEKRRIYQKKWNEENKERIKEYHKKWREENLEKAREYGRRWARENKEHVKAYRERNKERIRERAKQYYQEHKEEMYKSQQKYIAKNRAHVTYLLHKKRKENAELFKAQGQMYCYLPKTERQNKMVQKLCDKKGLSEEESRKLLEERNWNIKSILVIEGGIK